MKYKSRTRLAALLGAPTPPPSSDLLSPEAIAGMTAWWKMDEESGVRADSHGGNDLTDISTVLFAAGKQGNAASLVGAQNELLSRAAGENAELRGGNRDFSFAGWYNVGSVTSNAQGVVCYAGGNTKRGYWFNTKGIGNTDRIPRAGLGSGTSTTLSTATWGSQIPLNEWHFFAVWHDATAKEYFLQIDDATPVGGVYTGTAGVPASTAFEIGRYNADNTHGITGLVDEVVFFQEYVLTEVDRAVLWNGGAGIAYEQATGA